MNISIYIIKYTKYIIRVTRDFFKEFCQKIFNNSTKLQKEYLTWVFQRNQKFSEDFVKSSIDNISQSNVKTKLITFYLPQFYENEINNENFGKGFMEWYNTTKAIPQFLGHNQPQLPIDVGFYNLSNDDIMYRQIELAKKYGIYGFCFYYYWFSGDRLLEKPLDNFLKNRDLNMPFCLFWANETWTRLWGDGNHRKVIKKQELKENDEKLFIEDIIKYFQDSRYIKIGNKPLLIIYKTEIFEKGKFIDFINTIKSEVKKHGFQDIFILTTDCGFGKIDAFQYNLDGIVEFTHRDIVEKPIFYNMKNKYINPNFKGRVYDIKKSLLKNKHIQDSEQNIYKCVTAGWDNTARKAYSGAEVFQMSPADYKKWLKDVIIWTKKCEYNSNQFVFIDSWNEWAEGAHLEPDQHYGYAYLQATKEVLEETACYPNK